jgi:hypothetical protein
MLYLLPENVLLEKALSVGDPRPSELALHAIVPPLLSRVDTLVHDGALFGAPTIFQFPSLLLLLLVIVVLSHQVEVRRHQEEQVVGEDLGSNPVVSEVA